MIELLCTDYNKKATSIHYYFGNAVLGIKRDVLNQIGIKIDMYWQEHRFSPATPVFRWFDV